MMQMPVSAAVVVVVEHEQRFLLLEEERGRPQGRVWYFPSGALEAGESLAEAARRECREESGFDVAPEGIIAIDHGTFRDPAGLQWWRIAISARLIEPSPVPVNEPDVVAVDWFDLDQVAGLRLRSGDAVELCERALRGRLLPLDACRLAETGTLEGFFA